MQLKTILNRVQKFKSFVYQDVRWVNASQTALIVAIVARAKSRPLCSGCHRRAKWYDTRKTRLYEAFEIALYHTLGDLPEPESTHRFW